METESSLNSGEGQEQEPITEKDLEMFVNVILDIIDKDKIDISELYLDKEVPANSQIESILRDLIDQYTGVEPDDLGDNLYAVCATLCEAIGLDFGDVCDKFTERLNEMELNN